jgi:hypothetical protein
MSQTEVNKRGAPHVHGQHHCGATPGLIADVAEDDELRALVLAGLDTQLQAEMPLVYHLVDIARKVLRIGARRDASADIPRPAPELIAKEHPPTHSEESWAVLERRRRLTEEWLPLFTRHAMLGVANRNVHEHCGTCLVGKRGKSGCRLCAPWGHDVDTTRIVELFINDTEHPAPAAQIEYRCRVCHAEGALTDTMLLPDTRTRKIAEEDQRRDLYYTAANPTPRAQVGDDVRVLQVDLQRKLLPTLHLVKSALVAGNSPDATAGLCKVLRDMITENQEFVDVLAAPELHLVRARLMKLTEEPTDIESEDAVQSTSMLVQILEAWTENKVTCRNSIIADFSLVLSGCTRGNAVPYSLGAGQGSKSASLYQIKYMRKDCVEIAGSASVLVDAYKHIKEFQSTALDSGTKERQAKHFCERVINTGMELEAVQAAALVLGIPSSGASDPIQYFSGWDVL